MNNLREIRELKNISQWKLAKDSGVHQSRISLIENNYVVATVSEKERLAKSLGCLPEELFGPNPLVRLVASARNREV
jgi:transcriptional regulator with XRE-family HTH domain